MFEGVLTSLLNKYLGDFIEGLDAEQLQLGVWGGEIHLKDLSVKPSALDFLHLPVQVRSGRLGSLRIKINWRAIFSQPVEVELSGLSVVACSKDITRIDGPAEEARALEGKMKALKALEEFVLSPAFQAALMGKAREHKEAQKQGMVGRMIATIIDNIQISVRQVHVRFEHAGEADGSGGTVGGSPTALGIVLHSLRVCSTDEAGNERFVAAGPSASDPSKQARTFKRAELRNFYVYFNTSRSARGLTRPADERDMRAPFVGMDDDDASEQVSGNACDFLVRPISGTVRLELNKNDPAASAAAGAASEPPAMLVRVQLQGIEVTIDDVQYHALMKVLASISAASTADRLVAQRYADRFREGTPGDQARYIALYRRTIAPSWEEELNPGEAAEIARLEKELAHEDLALYRDIVWRSLRAQFPSRPLAKRVTAAARAAEASFMSRWVGKGMSAAKSVMTLGMGSSSAPADDQRVPAPERELSEQERQDILDAALDAPPRYADTPLPPTPKSAEDEALDLASAAEAGVPRSFVALALELEQPHLSLSLLNASRRSLLSLVVSQTRLKFLQRKVGSSMLAAVTVGNITLCDQVTPNSLYPELFGKAAMGQKEKMAVLAANAATSPRAHTQGSGSVFDASAPVVPLSPSGVGASAPLIDLLYEAHPLDPSCCDGAALRVVARVLPSLLVVHSRWVSRLLAFFATPTADLHKPEQVAEMGSWSAKTLESLKASTKGSVLKAFESGTQSSARMAIFLDAHVALPSVIVSSAPNMLHSPVLVADLGVLSVNSANQNEETIKLLRDTIAINEALETAKAKAAVEEKRKQEEEARGAAGVGYVSPPLSPLAIGPIPSALAPHVPLLSESEMKQCYDRIHVRLQGVQVFLSQASSAVGGRGFDARSTLPLLCSSATPLGASLRVDRSIAPSLGWLPPLRVEGEVPLLELEVSSESMVRLMSLGKSLGNMAPPPPPPEVQAAIRAAASSPHSMRSRNLSPPLPAASPRSRPRFSRTNSRAGPGGSGTATPHHVFDRRPNAPSLNSAPSFSSSLLDESDDLAVSPLSSPHHHHVPALSEKEFLSLDDLTLLFSSEREARRLMADLDADGNGSVSREEYLGWVMARKQARKGNKGMEVEFRVGIVKIKLVDDRRPMQMALSPLASSASSVGTQLASSSSGPFHPPRDVLLLSLGPVQFRQTTLAYSSAMSVEVGSIQLQDALSASMLSSTTSGQASAPPVGELRSILSSVPSKASASAAADAPLQPFLRVSLRSTSEEHPDFGHASLAEAEEAEQALYAQEGDHDASEETMLPMDLEVELGNVVLQADPHAINDIAMFVLKDFLPKPEPAEATPAQAVQPSAALPTVAESTTPVGSAAANPAQYPDPVASLPSAVPAEASLRPPVLVMSPVGASALSSRASPSDGGAAMEAAVAAAQAEQRQVQAQQRVTDAPVAPAIAMRLRLRMATFQLQLSHRRSRPIMKLATQNLSVSLYTRAVHVGGGLRTKVRIPKLALVDQLGARPVAVLIGLEPALAAGASSPSSRTLVAPPCLELDFTMFSPVAARAFGYASHVQVALRGVKIVQDFRFYGSLLAFLWEALALPFIAGDKQAASAAASDGQPPEQEAEQVAPAPAPAPAAASSNASAAPSPLTERPLPFLKFSVLLEDIEVVFPNHKTNDPLHRITIHVRQLDVTNNVLLGDVEAGSQEAAEQGQASGANAAVYATANHRLVEYQQFAVGIGGLTVLSSAFPGSEAGSRATTLMHLSRMGVAVSMTQALPSASLDVRVDAHRLDVTIPQEQYAFIMGNMLWAILDNLSGLWAPPPLDPNEVKQVPVAAVADASSTSVAPAAASSVASADASASSAPASGAAKPPSWIRVFVRFDSFSVSLLKGKGWSPASDGLISVLGQDMDVRFWMDSVGAGGKGMGVEAAFAALEVVDDSVAPAAAAAASIFEAKSDDDEDDDDESVASSSPAGAMATVRPEYRRMVTLRDQRAMPAPLEVRFRSAFDASRAASAVQVCDLRELVAAHRRPAPPEPSGAMFASWFCAAAAAPGADALAQAEAGAMDVEVRLRHLAYCVCSMVVVELGGFFVVPPPAASAPTVDSAESAAPSNATVGSDADKALYGRGSPTAASSAPLLDPAREEEAQGVLLLGDALLTGAVSPPPVPPPAGLVLRVKLSMPRALIQLVSSVSEPQARALNVAFDLALEFGMGHGAMRASVVLDDLRMREGTRPASDGGFPAIIEAVEKSNVGSDSSEDKPSSSTAAASASSGTPPSALLLRPVDIHVSFLSEPSRLFGPAHSSMHLDVGVTDLMLEMGFQHYLLLQGALAVMFPPSKPAVAAAGTSEAAGDKAQAAALPHMSPSPSTSSASASASPAAAEVAPPSATTVTLPSGVHFSEMNLHVQVHRVHVLLLNDAYAHSLYLLRLSVDNLLAKVHRFGESGGVFARLDLAADSFNPRVLAWEPLLEPWDLTVSQHVTQVRGTPQEYLLLNPPRRGGKRHAITQEAMDSRSTTVVSSVEDDDDDDEESTSLSDSSSSFPRQGSVSASSAAAGAQGSPQRFLTNKRMSPSAIAEALLPLTDLSVSSSRPFNVVLSVGALQDLLDYVALLPGMKLRRLPQRTMQAPPYRLENHTNLDLELYMSASDSMAAPALGSERTKRDSVVNLLREAKNASVKAMSAVGLGDVLGESSTSPAAPAKSVSPAYKVLLVQLASERVRVPAYGERDLEFPEAIAPNQRAFVVQFLPPTGDGASSGALSTRLAEFTLAVSQNKSVRLDLAPRRSAAPGEPAFPSSSDPVIVVADLSVRRGVRVVSLHSDVALANQTDGVLAVQTTLHSEHLLPRGKIFWLPIMSASKKRRVKVRPYETKLVAGEQSKDISAVEPEASLSLAHQSAQAKKMKALAPAASSVSSSFSVDSSTAIIGPEDGEEVTSPRMLGPTLLAEEQLLYHWSGDLVCDHATHKQLKSERTNAMHYRCTKRSGKVLQKRGSASSFMLRKPLLHSDHTPLATTTHTPGSPLPFPSGGGSSTPSPMPSSPGLDDASDASAADAHAFNFTVYASVWKKKEQRRIEAEEAMAAEAAGGSNGKKSSKPDDTASSLSPEPLDSAGSGEATFGELAKKRYCSVWYVRNTLTVENFLASPVGVRMYHTERQRDEELKVVSGVTSPPAPEVAPAGYGSHLALPDAAPGGAGKDKDKSKGLGGLFSSSFGLGSGDKPSSPPRLIEEILLDRGQAFPSHAVSTHLDTLLSLRLPGVAAAWSEPVLLKLSSEPQTIKFHLHDAGARGVADATGLATSVSSSSSAASHGMLTVLGEVSVMQGHVHVILYSHYWLFDLSNLGLLLVNDETRMVLPRRSKERTLMEEGGEEGTIEDRMIERNNAELRAQDLAPATTGRSPDPTADKQVAALLQSDASPIDVVQPVMFSSKHHASKKQRVRLQAGWVQELDTRAAIAAPAPGSLALQGKVDRSFLGPTGDPAGHAAPVLAGSPNFLVQWSDSSAPFSMEHVGTTESISIPSSYVLGVSRALLPGEKMPQRAPGEGATFELVCSVANGPGRFYRTKQVTFAPRFVMVNKLNVPVLVRQYSPPSKSATASSSSAGAGVSVAGGSALVSPSLLPSIVRLVPGETHIFHWPHPVRERRPWVCFKREGPGMDGWHWTGFIDLTVAGDSPMLVTHARSHQSWFAHIDVRLGAGAAAGTAFVLIDEFKQQGLVEQLAMELPFLVQNRSATHTIRFRQARDRPELSSRFGALIGSATGSPSGGLLSPSSSSASTAAGGADSSDWLEVPPHGMMPFVWEEPLQEHVLLVQFSVLDGRTRKIVDWQKEKRVRFDSDGSEEDATLRVTRGQATDAAASSVPAASASASPDTVKVYYFTETSGPTQVLVFADRSHRKRNTLLSGVLRAAGGMGDEGASPEATSAGTIAEEDEEMKEIPDDAGRVVRGGGRFAAEATEADGGLPAYDPANETEEDRRVRLALQSGESADEALAPPLPAASSSSAAAPAAASSSALAAPAVPADFTGPGVLQVTVKEASGFKSSRRHMFAAVVFAGMRQRTDVAHNTREPKWGRRMNFATKVDSDDFELKACGCFSAPMQGTGKKGDKASKASKSASGAARSASPSPSSNDSQVLYVNVYEKTSFSDHFLGCATVRLREIGFDHADKWVDVLKYKGAKRGWEKRGKVHLGLWWQQDGAHAAANAIHEEEVAMVLAADGSPLPPAAGASASSSGTGTIGTISSPRLHRMSCTQTHLEAQGQLWRLTQCAAYEACDASTERVWSEYRVRFLTTALFKELAQAHQLDFARGRLVAYITCPLMPRAFSVLLSDHGVYNLCKKWRQDIRFCLPHHQGKRFRKHALVRITLFFFRSENDTLSGRQRALETSAASPYGNPLHGGLAAPISGRAGDLYSRPVRVGEATFDLMSVREVSDVLGASASGSRSDDSDDDAGNEEKQQLEDELRADDLDARAVEEAEREEDIAAGRKRSTADSPLQKTKKKTKKQLLAEERHRQRTEWQRKWIPIVSSVKTSSFDSASAPAASPSSSTAVPRVPALCLNVKRTVIDRERHKAYRPTTTSVRVSFPLLGLSVVDTTPEEVCYLSIRGVALSLNDSNWQTTLSASIDNMQLDNLLARAAFPVVFNKSVLRGSDVPLGPHGQPLSQPFIQVALNKKKTRLPNLSLFPYFSLLVQKMDVRVEEANIWRTLTFINQLALRMGGDLDQDLQAEGLTRRWTSTVLSVPPTGTHKLFFKLLHVQPLALNVSFAAQPGMRQSSSSYHINPLFTAINMLEAGIGNINEAPLRLNGKLIENALGTSDTIVWSLVSHYIQQAVMEGYKIVGSVEFLGNPVGLAHELGTGTLDFFTEPAKGLLISPEAFGSGLAKGSGSLIKGTVGGLMSAASAVTSSASKAMATASGDDAFMASQAAARSGHQPEHLADGLKMGVSALGNSLFSGVTGVFLDPLAGARKEGVLGFGKGLVKGVAGLAFKPLAGVLDLTTNTLKGLGNTAGYLLDGPVEALKPVRPQRYIDPRAGVIQPFDLAAALQHDTRWHKQKDKNNKQMASSSTTPGVAAGASAPAAASSK